MQAARRHSRPAITGFEAVAAVAGFALVAAAGAASQRWLDRHFLPSFFLPRHWYVLIESVVRGLIAIVGVLLVIGRSRLTRLLTRAPGMTLSITLAAALAVASGELALRWIQPRPTEWLLPEEEPRRQDDPQIGWVLAPSRTGRSSVSGRVVEYTIDAAGDRVRDVRESIDRGRETLIFAGESVMFGEGLAWDESIPAQVGSMLGVQTANLAVHGYSTDQMYLRLTRELPRFEKPSAVVSIFMTELFGRNLDTDRPHLESGLVWQPAERKSKLMSLATLLVPYRRDTTVERGISLTHDVFRTIVELARRRGAVPLVVVPLFGPEDEMQQAIRERVLAGDIPAVLVRLDPDWRLVWDRHPNARAAHVIAAAVATRLQRR